MENLLYISGSGRSGSTLVERVLNSSPRFVAVGEFHVLWRLPLRAITCSCGAGIERCDFWQAVLHDAAVTPTDLAALADLEGRLARSGHVAANGFSLPRLAADEATGRFLAPQFAIFEAVAALAGKPVVVDSSKAGPRAWLMATAPVTRIIHLYRDPTQVIASWRSVKFDKGLGTAMARPNVAAAAADWWKSEHLARRLAQETAVGMVDYRSFCAAPGPGLAAALSAAELTGSDGIDWQDARTVLPGAHYHSLNGNPDRFDTGPIKVAARTVDWSRYGLADRLAIPAAGTALATLYRPRG